MKEIEYIEKIYNCDYLINKEKLVTPFYYTFFSKFNYVGKCNYPIKLLSRFSTHYDNLFKFKDELITDPEDLDEKFLLENYKDNDYYYVWAYVVYYSNKGKNNLLSKIKFLLSFDPNNPDLLARLARYYASNLYKLSNYDKRNLLIGLKYGLKAQKIREKILGEKIMPTFIYGWNGYIYMELNKNKKAIEYYDRAIYLNKKYYNYEQAEPFIWKAFALTKLGKFKESNDILLRIENHSTINQPSNDKRDFRFYRRLAENFIGLGDYEKALSYLKKTIDKYLLSFSFHISYNGDLVTLNKNNLIYYGKGLNLLGNDVIEQIIQNLAFLYKKYLNGEEIIFKDTRGIEKVCFDFVTKFKLWN